MSLETETSVSDCYGDGVSRPMGSMLPNVDNKWNLRMCMCAVAGQIGTKGRAVFVGCH